MTTLTSPAEPHPSAQGFRPSLLVVDDELGPRDSLRMVFQRDFTVYSFDNGVDAVEFVRHNPVHVAILDLCMSGIDGIETLRRLKDVDPGIEAIMLTAYSDMNSTVAALRLSACDYQKKPFNVPELEAAVKRALQRRLRTESIRAAEQRLHALFANIRTMSERESKLLTTTTRLEGVIHDINNPLTVVLGYAELLAGRLSDAKASGAALDLAAMESEIDIIRRHTEICTNITERYYAVNRTSAGETWCEVGQALRDFQVFASAHPVIRTSQVSVQSVEGKLEVPISATELVQILINLATNAFQHGGPANTVSIEAVVHNAPIDRRALPVSEHSIVRCLSTFSAQPPFVRLSVADRGGGIAPDVLAKIFEPHFTTKAEKEGTGLGLAIVETLMTTARGLIQVNSTPGEGTRFTITFPARIVA